MKFSKYGYKELQPALNECYDYITKIAKISNRSDFIDSVNDLKKCNIKFWPWFWNNAITLSSGEIRLSKKWKDKDLISKSAILLHESFHLVQYRNGSLNWINYWTNRYKIELEAEKYEQLFRYLAKNNG